MATRAFFYRVAKYLAKSGSLGNRVKQQISNWDNSGSCHENYKSCFPAIRGELGKNLLIFYICNIIVCDSGAKKLIFISEIVTEKIESLLKVNY